MSTGYYSGINTLRTIKSWIAAHPPNVDAYHCKSSTCTKNCFGLAHGTYDCHHRERSPPLRLQRTVSRSSSARREQMFCPVFVQDFAPKSAKPP